MLKITTNRCTVAVVACFVSLSSYALPNTSNRPDAFGPSEEEREGGSEESGVQGGLEQIVVTAQKREERLIDVPISIAVVSSTDLQQMQITNLNDLTLVVPGMAVANQGGQGFHVEIRGISNFSEGPWPTIGMYLGEADVNVLYSQLNLNSYDMERVEVLRGPQGTLYGEGSSGGTIRFVPNQPNLNDLGFSSYVAGLITPGGAPSARVNMMLNAPVIDETLGVRIVATVGREGGWIDQPGVDRKNINGTDMTDVRATVLWQPVSQFSVSAMADIDRLNGGNNYGEDSHGNYTQTLGVPTSPQYDNNYEVYNLKMSYDIGWARAINSLTYLDSYLFETDSSFLFPLAPPPAAPLQSYISGYGFRQHATSDEFRLSSSNTTFWHWTFGGEYRSLNYLGSVAERLAFAPPVPSDLSYAADTALTSHSWAAFADTSIKVADVTLGAGVRYFVDSEKYNTTDLLAGSQSPLQAQTFHSLDPRAYLQYEPVRNLNIYASAGKGFRSGGFNLNSVSFDPETVWTYELGAKTSLFDRRLSVDVDVFYSDYTSYQILGFAQVDASTVPVEIVNNGGSALIRGFEWQTGWSPLDKLVLSFNGALMTTKFYKATNAQYQAGDSLDFVPKYQFTVSAKREFQLGSKDGYVRVDYGLQGRETYRVRTIGPFFYSESDVLKSLNIGAALNLSEKLRVGIFGRNLTNCRGYTSPDVVQNLAARQQPLTVGVEFSTSL